MVVGFFVEINNRPICVMLSGAKHLYDDIRDPSLALRVT